MRHPTVAEFREILLEEPLDQVVTRYVFGGEPYVFRRTPAAFRLLRGHLCARLGLAEENIVIVGSAKTGFSLSPSSFPRRFTDASDIDVVVVDQTLFDRIWLTILRWHYPRRRARLDGVDWKWKRDRTDELYWGWFFPDGMRFKGLSFPEALKPLRDISSAWFDAFRSLSAFPEFAVWEVSGKLYRTWDHALEYHVDGLRQIKERIQGSEGE